MHTKVVLDKQDISTHSLTKRLTYPPSVSHIGASHFNSQPHEEADRTHSHLPTVESYFNSQPHEEADSRSL